jgi:hypothetical protein
MQRSQKPTRDSQRNVPERVPRALSFAAAGLLSLAFTARSAQACGGFFCGFTQPVGQNAEHILFEVGADSVTMTAQITYTGEAADFAWILPLGAVPDPSALSVFPQQALDLLDTLTAPTFTVPNDCIPPSRNAYAVPDTAAVDTAPSAVNVYVRTEVGPYDVAVVGSADPSELVNWLRTAGYRITPAMEPYVAQYTAAGMSFLALKLQQSKGVKDIQPFRFTLPGTAPSIPLRMTAIAADPEMAIQVFVLAEQRYEGKNWNNLTIPTSQVHFNPSSGFVNVRTNWSALIAKTVDAAGGQGWVTEFAGSAASFASQVNAQLRSNLQNAPYSNPNPDTTQAQQALYDVLTAHGYLTRLQTRLSAEEMTSDPIFGASERGDVPQARALSRVVDGVDQCASASSGSTDECDFTTCGAAGICRSVSGSERSPGSPAITGCACLPGATARVTTAPDSTATVICQDARLSFLNPGDQGNDAAEVLPDPCAGFSCGGHGQCVPVNLAPTCVCDQGYVAVGGFAGPPGSSPQLSCVAPRSWVPVSFYNAALPALPDDLPGGRDVTLSDGSFPLPRFNAAAAATEGGCALAPLTERSKQGERSGGWGWLCAGAALALSQLRRRTAKE